MSQIWDGKKRRSSDFQPDDHDKIIELMAILAGHITNFSSHVGSFQQHIKDDKECFRGMNEKLDKLLQTKYLMLGGVFVIVTIIEWVFKIIK